MAIDFAPERWDRIRKNAALWWEGKLDRPLIQCCAHGARDPGRPRPDTPCHHFTSHYGLDFPFEKIFAAHQWSLESNVYLGDAFPYCWMNFGPGILAAFCGSDLVNTEHSTYFSVPNPSPVRDLTIRFNPDSPWFRRVEACCRAATACFKGTALVGTTDMGGILDVLASFRTSENLLTDLYDDPEEVERLIRETQDAWFTAYNRLETVLDRRINPGHSYWTPLYSEKPYAMFQSDFSYMIGPAHFDRFVVPEMAESCRRLAGNAFYHLDGTGQLVHLDSLLSIPELKGIQWIPGDGTPRVTAWMDVYRRILAAGKLAQVDCLLDDLPIFERELGSLRNMAILVAIPPERMSEAKRILAHFGVDAND